MLECGGEKLASMRPEEEEGVRVWRGGSVRGVGPADQDVEEEEKCGSMDMGGESMAKTKSLSGIGVVLVDKPMGVTPLGKEEANASHDTMLGRAKPRIGVMVWSNVNPQI